ncbi:MAG: adenosylcobinamide-phosphate synthase CbiB [Methylococcaceae bacterium]
MFELALLAYLIDLFIGELPCKHPVVFMGQFISYFEQRFYQNKLITGALLVLSLLFSTAIITYSLIYLSSLLPDWLELISLAIITSTGLAMNLLHSSVAELLNNDNPKQALSYLVSRDTQAMDDTQIHKAAIETWAENLSDGVIAPLFYLTLFGVSGIAIYKAINTLDSMVGYKTERYFYFGKTAAILDDIANYIPARLTALLIIILADNKRLAWQCAWRDGAKLESPNAGYPIAAMAGSLGVALGGNAYYHGQLKLKAQLGEAINNVSQETLIKALAMKQRFDITLILLLSIAIYFS